MTQSKYSDWMRVDLHIHTDWSKKTKQNDYKGIFSVETLKAKLKENNVDVFSMTDHNIINHEAYEEYYDSYDPIHDPLLLVGVELDIIVTGGRNQTYHSLLVFNYSDKNNAKRLFDLLETKYSEKEINDFDRSLTIEEIVQLFPNEDFFFIPHAGNTKSIIDSYKHDINTAQKMVLLMQSAFEKVPEKNIHRYNEGFDKHLIDTFKNKEDNAYLQFSDNHNAGAYPCTGKDGEPHEFYYLKGSKSFETLRLAFIDPKSRIMSQSQYSSLENQTNYIESIEIAGDLFLKDAKITFSPHLNVLIGGRSSGKSLLMSIFGEKIDGIESHHNEYNVDFDKILIKSLRDATHQSITSISKDQLIYINQNEIVRYFEEKNLYVLAKSAGIEEPYDYSKKKFNDQKNDLNKHLENLLDSYNNIGGQNEFTKHFILHSSTIEEMLSGEYVFKFEYERVLGENNKESIINSTLDNVTNLKEYTILFKESDFLEFTTEEMITINEFESLVETKLSFVKNKKKIQAKKNFFLKEINNIITEKNKQLNLNARKKADAISSLSSFKKEISTRFSKLVDLKSKTKVFEEFNYSLKKEIAISDNVLLVIEVKNTISLKDLFLDGILRANNEKTSYINLLGLLSGKKSIKNHSDNSTDTLRRKSTSQLKEIYKALENPKDYLQYEDGSTSERNSPGFNSEKYLQIILSSSTSKFVFIDQPEDNLGNKFIAETLVEILREIKFKKQVFLVTHNPSVVVYGDAENVIIAHNDGSNISYEQHVIEDPNAQKEICNILDGGEYIFDMRSKKYNIQKLLKTN